MKKALLGITTTATILASTMVSAGISSGVKTPA